MSRVEELRDLIEAEREAEVERLEAVKLEAELAKLTNDRLDREAEDEIARQKAADEAEFAATRRAQAKRLAELERRIVKKAFEKETVEAFKVKEAELLKRLSEGYEDDTNKMLGIPSSDPARLAAVRSRVKPMIKPVIRKQQVEDVVSSE